MVGCGKELRETRTGHIYNGVWRSLVARSAGGREGASSNLVTPSLKALIYKGFSHT